MNFWEKVRGTASRLDQVSYYEILGIDRAAASDAIGERFYRLAARLHPDKHALHKDADDKTALNRIYARMAEAREVLMSPEKRGNYDEGLSRGEMRLVEPDGAAKKTAEQDPKTPLARSLYEEAIASMRAGDKASARSKLSLASQYEADSVVIQAAIDELEGKPVAEQEPAPVSAPVSVSQAPLPEPAAAPPKKSTLPPPAPKARQHVRQAAAMPVRLRVPSWDGFKTFYTRDVSQGGMFLRTKKGLPLGTRIALSISAPSGDSIEISSRVVRLAKSADGEVEGVALQFAALSDKAKEQIASLMRTVAAQKRSSQKPDLGFILEALVEELVRLRVLPPHEVLGVSKSASQEEIKNAYKAVSRRFQPHQVNQDDVALLDISKELLDCIRAAYKAMAR